ncbi:MAG: DUF1674 domain-containing protein [Gammaproteobacteria bacterium]
MPEPGPNARLSADDVTRVDAEREPQADAASTSAATAGEGQQPQRAREVGGRDGLDPTRYGDWEYKGRCIDF